MERVITGKKNFQYETWKTDFEDHFIVIPQIESQTGVDNVDSIAAHPLVTALGLGPYDLSADLGCCWNPENEDYLAALDRVKAAADAVGKKVWAGTDVSALQAKGYTFLWVGTATSVLTNALSQIVEGVKNPDTPEFRTNGDNLHQHENDYKLSHSIVIHRVEFCTKRRYRGAEFISSQADCRFEHTSKFADRSHDQFPRVAWKSNCADFTEFD